jgi:aromatic ring hydroxylase
LENKQLFKRGKYIKAGNRTIDGWMKILPEPTNAEQIKSFEEKLKNNYELTLEKYIDYYEKGVDNKSSLSEATVNILIEQRSWISELREKILDGVIEESNSGMIFLTIRIILQI